MSDETYAAMEDAIRAHVADETDGGYLTAWHLAAHAAIPADADGSSYVYATHDGAPHEWWGLLNMAQRRAARWDEGERE